MHPRLRHLPNALTVMRLCALPAIVVVYVARAPGASWAAAWIVLVAALSDVADGFIARRYHVQSEFGRWIDPIVDRLFFFTIVITLWACGTLPWWGVLPLLIRDGVILGLALPMLWFTAVKPQVSRWGRASNLVLIFAIEWFILDLRPLAWAFFAVGASLYVITGLQYGYVALTWGRRSRSATA
jgi:CDP-diacylglycerol--glycerol-3-phosphate 3-phosphatidyltransferase